jgi:MFS family permease
MIERNKNTNRWVMLGVLFIARVTMGFQFQSIASLSPLMVNEFGIGVADLGILIGLYVSPGIFFALPGGTVGRIFGDKKVVTAAMVLMLLGGVITTIGSHYNLQILGRVIAGVGGVFLNVLMAKMVTDYFSGKEISLAMGIFANSWPVGIASALLILPLVGEFTSFYFAMGVVVLFTLIGLLLFTSFYIPVEFLKTPRNGKIKISKTALKAVLFAGIIWAFYNAALGMIFGFAPIFLIEKGWTILEASSATSLVLWVAVISIPIGGYIADRTGHKDVILLFSLLVFAGLLSLVPHVDAVILIFILIGIFGGLGAGPILALPSEVLGPETRAFGLGIFFTLFYIGTFFAPVLAGTLSQFTGSTGVAFYIGSIMLILSCLAWVGFRISARQFYLKNLLSNDC